MPAPARASTYGSGSPVSTLPAQPSIERTRRGVLFPAKQRSSSPAGRPPRQAPEARESLAERLERYPAIRATWAHLLTLAPWGVCFMRRTELAARLKIPVRRLGKTLQALIDAGAVIPFRVGRRGVLAVLDDTPRGPALALTRPPGPDCLRLEGWGGTGEDLRALALGAVASLPALIPRRRPAKPWPPPPPENAGPRGASISSDEMQAPGGPAFRGPPGASISSPPCTPLEETQELQQQKPTPQPPAGGPAAAGPGLVGPERAELQAALEALDVRAPGLAAVLGAIADASPTTAPRLAALRGIERATLAKLAAERANASSPAAWLVAAAKRGHLAEALESQARACAPAPAGPSNGSPAALATEAPSRSDWDSDLAAAVAARSDARAALQKAREAADDSGAVANAEGRLARIEGLLCEGWGSTSRAFEAFARMVLEAPPSVPASVGQGWPWQRKAAQTWRTLHPQGHPEAPAGPWASLRVSQRARA